VNHRLTITAAIATAAASTTLMLLISGGKWFFGGLGAIIVVALVGTATRHRARRALPAVVCLLCALVALALYLNLVYAASYSYIHLIPSPRSLSELWHSAVTALRATKSQTPPVRATVGIELAAGAGIGLVAAVTDLIAVRLRRCALAGLPLLVLFSVPIGTSAGSNATEDTLVFCVGMAGYLALLSADGRERLRVWGRLVTPWNATHPDEPDGELGQGPSARALAASGRRVGLAAVVLALIAPLLIPGLHVHKLFPGSGNGNGTGLGGRGGVEVSVNPLAAMTNDLRQSKPVVEFTYHTTDPHPQYLVEYELNKMTATTATWQQAGQRMSQVGTGQRLPAVPGLTAANVIQVRTTVRMVASATLGFSYLPVPYAPRELTLPKAGLEVDAGTLMLYSPLTSLSGIGYTVASEDVDPTPAQFAAATAAPTGMDSWLSVPTPLRSLASLARRIVGKARTPYAKAQALQAWLRSDKFSYNVYATEPDTPDALYDFLTKTKSGYCEQFAFAMTVLARLLGIPARVAVGFDQGTYLGDGNYRVESTDAHAWTQLYFSGLGWLTWDPTPAGSAVGQTNSVPPGYTTHTSGGSGSPSPSTGPTVAPHRGRTVPGINRKALSIPGAAGGGKTPAGTGAGGGPPVPLIVVAVLLAAVLLTPRAIRSLTRRRRWLTAHDDAGRAHAAWAEVLDDLTDLGVGHGPGETSRAVAARVGDQQRLSAAGRQALDRLAVAEERARYARQAGSAATLAADVVTLRGAVAASVTRTARGRARLVPPSAIERIRRILAHGLDVFGWLEVAISRLTDRLPRPRIDQG
jgi:transglutaminase-like putative cysteine protease